MGESEWFLASCLLCWLRANPCADAKLGPNFLAWSSEGIVFGLLSNLLPGAEPFGVFGRRSLGSLHCCENSSFDCFTPHISQKYLGASDTVSLLVQVHNGMREMSWHCEENPVKTHWLTIFDAMCNYLIQRWAKMRQWLSWYSQCSLLHMYNMFLKYTFYIHLQAPLIRTVPGKCLFSSTSWIRREEIEGKKKAKESMPFNIVVGETYLSGMLWENCGCGTERQTSQTWVCI